MPKQDDRLGGDIQSPTSGDYSVDNFPDWDNPEDADDEREDAPEGYYDEADDDDGYIPGPGDPDYDLSEAAGYAGYEPPRRRGIMPQWIIFAVSIVLILSILVPLLLRA